MPKFQYLILELNLGRDLDGGEERLNNLGSEGWEIVAVGVQFTSHFVYLRRKLNAP